MKLYLKLILGIVGPAIISSELLAADPITAHITYTTNTYTPPNHAASGSVATSSANAVILGLNAQALLLREMMQEHEKRAADLTQKSQIEKAKWETELANELQEKSARVQKSIDQATQLLVGTNDFKAAAGNLDDQLLFVSTVEARLEQVRQELSAAIDDTRVISTQLATNKAPEDISGISLVLVENQRLVKDLQREQLDLELRKLEFRAISKAMQR